MEYRGLSRWLSLSRKMTEERLIDFDCHMLRQQKKLRKKYLANIYVLNKVSQRRGDLIGCSQDLALVFQTKRDPQHDDRAYRCC